MRSLIAESICSGCVLVIYRSDEYTCGLGELNICPTFYVGSGTLRATWTMLFIEFTLDMKCRLSIVIRVVATTPEKTHNQKFLTFETIFNRFFVQF